MKSIKSLTIITSLIASVVAIKENELKEECCSDIIFESVGSIADSDLGSVILGSYFEIGNVPDGKYIYEGPNGNRIYYDDEYEVINQPKLKIIQSPRPSTDFKSSILSCQPKPA